MSREYKVTVGFARDLVVRSEGALLDCVGPVIVGVFLLEEIVVYVLLFDGAVMHRDVRKEKETRRFIPRERSSSFSMLLRRLPIDWSETLYCTPAVQYSESLNQARQEQCAFDVYAFTQYCLLNRAKLSDDGS